MRGFLIRKSLSTAHFLRAGLFMCLELYISSSTLELELDLDESSILLVIILMSLFLRGLEAGLKTSKSSSVTF